MKEEADKKTVMACLACGSSAFKKFRPGRSKYCSRECVSAGYKVRMAGEDNPNFRNKPPQKCEVCRQEFFTYTKGRRFCSQACYQRTRPQKPPRQFKLILLPPKKVKERKRKEPAKVTKVCLHCKSEFVSFRSAGRVYCSYQCHLASGGALRAGLASMKAKIKYGPKKDANHSEIFDALREAGVPVYDTSSLGRGMPDGIAWINEAWHLFDVKNPKTAYGRKGLNKTQAKWLNQWQGGPVYLLYTADDAKKFARGEFDQVKFQRSGWQTKEAA